MNRAKLRRLALYCALSFTPMTAFAEKAGTTIVGEQESDMGLIVLPWAQEHPSDLDRPPVPLPGPPVPLSAESFAEMERYERERLAYRRERLERVK